MSTLDNINNNILQKIEYIDKIYDLYKNKLKIEVDNNVPTYTINVKLLEKKYKEYNRIKELYIIQSILFLTEYHTLYNNNSNNSTNEYQQDIYNESIFIISNELDNNDFILDNDDIIELKKIYYNNYYKYKYYNININKPKNNNNNKLSKNIYSNFNIFIISENIYNHLDNYIDYITCFLNAFKNYLEINNKNSIPIIKKIFILINHYKKTKLNYNIDLVDYDMCSCGNKMIVQSNSSELLCIKCGYIFNLVGSIFEDSQFYNQEGGRYAHGSYDPIRHCKFWIERIQAKENTLIDEAVVSKIKKCIEKDKIENLKNISIEQFRLYLKQTKLSKYNDHIPLIKKIITGYIPPQLTYNELHLIYNYFDKAIKTYDIIKPKEKSNALYYPFILAKLIQIIVKDQERKKGLLGCIHLQSYNTLIDNDKIWEKICNYNNNFKYIPTDKFNLT